MSDRRGTGFRRARAGDPAGERRRDSGGVAATGASTSGATAVAPPGAGGGGGGGAGAETSAGSARRSAGSGPTGAPRVDGPAGVDERRPTRRSRTSWDGRGAAIAAAGSRRSISRAAIVVPASWLIRRRYEAADRPDRPDVLTPAAASAQSMHHVRPRASTRQSAQMWSSQRRQDASAVVNGCLVHDDTGLAPFGRPPPRGGSDLHRPTTHRG